MDQRFERFAMRALWIIMWMLIRNRDDEIRVNQWRREYLNAGGGTVEAPLPKTES